MHKQIALCIGNDDYQNSCLNKLYGAVNDAKAIANKLKKLNFDVKLEVNLNRHAMYEALEEFEATLPDYDVALFYFAGHGFEVDGDNLLMPIDTPEGEKALKKWNALQLTNVIDALEGKKHNNHVKTKIIILDACRQNLSDRGNRRGFAPIFAPAGTIIAFSTSPGQGAGELNGHGKYTNILIELIDTPRTPIENMFKKVRESLSALTHGEQISWEHTSLMGNYYFNEDRIDTFSTYSEDALSDENYSFTQQSQIANIVKELKLYNWNQQNSAMNELRSIEWTMASVNDIFVLGRNIYQAAEGGAWEAEKFIKNFSTMLFIPLDAQIHLLNGMAYEIYYNAKGKFRKNRKNKFYLDIIALLENTAYLESRSFISNKLLEEKNVIVYIPGSEERFEFIINLKKSSFSPNENVTYLIDSIYYHGQNIFHHENEESEYEWSALKQLRQLKHILAKQVVAPVDMIKIRTNTEIEDTSQIAIPNDYILGFNND